MINFRISSQAQKDLEEIWDFIAEDNFEAADRIIDLLLEKFKTLRCQPKIGRLRKDLGSSLRSLAAGRYIIFYRQTEKMIDIIRVLHGARDIQTFF